MRRLGTTCNTRGFIFAVASMARFRGFHGGKKQWKTRIGTSVERQVRGIALKRPPTPHAKVGKKIGGAAGITTAAPRIAGQWGRGDNRLLKRRAGLRIVPAGSRLFSDFFTAAFCV